MRKVAHLPRAVYVLVALTFFLAACLAPATPTPTEVPPPPTPSPTLTPPTPTLLPTGTPTPRSSPTATPTPTPTATPVATPLPAFSSYKNTTYGFVLSYPETWDKTEGTPAQGALVEIAYPLGYPLLRVFLNYLGEETTLEEFANGWVDVLAAELDEFAIQSKGPVTLQGNVAAYEAVFTGATDGTKYKEQLLFTIRGTQGFFVQVIGTEDVFAFRREEIEKALRSFMLIEPLPGGAAGGKTLTLAHSGPSTLDPALSQDSSSHLFVLQIYGGLVAVSQDLKVVLDIAESVDVQNGTVYTFRLRRDVTFQDGTPVTANDFKYSWERAARPTTSSSTAGTYLGDIVGVKEMLAGKAQSISGVEVVDPYTLRVTIDKPRAYFLSKLTYPTAYVVDRKDVERGGEWWRKPNGTGPFRLKEWKEDEVLVLERNDRYYGQRAKLDTVVFRIFAGVPVRMFEAGEVDVATVDLSNLERVQASSSPLKGQLQVIPELMTWYYAFDVTKPPFNDPKVRKAFIMAVNREALVKETLAGAVVQAKSLLPPGMPGYTQERKPLLFDVASAKALLVEAGYADVAKFPETRFTDSGLFSPSPGVVEALTSWLKNLGITLRLSLLDPRAYYSRLPQLHGNLFTYGWVADYPDPQNFLEVLFHSGAENNVGGYSNKEFDRLLDEAAVETDQAKRMSLYQQAETVLLEDAPFIPLWHDVNYVLVKPYVKGYSPNALGLVDLKNVSVER